MYCQTDNAGVSYYTQSSLSASAANLIDAVVVNQIEGPTDLNFTFDSTPVYSGASETDIIYQVNSSVCSGTCLAATWCNDPVNGAPYRCDQHYVAYRASSTVSISVTCHETGHAVGLTHGQQAYPPKPNNFAELYCMRSPNSGVVSLGTNNIIQINATY